MILILNGSPNKDSKTLAVTNYLLEDTTETIKQYDLYRLDINPCDDCKYCDNKASCSKKDDMFDIYEDLEKADTLILSAPIYFAALSDVMMKTINRFQRYYSQKWILKEDVPTVRNLILVTTMASDKEYMFDGAKGTMRVLDKVFEPTFKENIMVDQSDEETYLEKHKEYIISVKEKMNI